MAKPPTPRSEISHKGTASYIAKVAKPLAKRMAKIMGMGHRKITDLDVSTVSTVAIVAVLALVLHSSDSTW